MKEKFSIGSMPAYPSFYVRKEHYKTVGEYNLNYKIAADFDIVLRFFNLPNIKFNYINQEVVKMRIGGVSTSSISSNITLNKEILESCRNNNVRCSWFSFLSKYPEKNCWTFKMILITGANGFLSKNLIPKLTENNKLNLLDRNDCDFNGNYFKKEINSTEKYIDALDNVTCIIHCAARVHIMDDTSTNPLDDYREVNTRGTLNLAEQAVKAGVKRFIFISSIKVNGESTQLDQPFKSDDQRAPEDFYGQSKSEAEEQLLQLAKETGLEVVIIRPTLVYGPGVKANFASLMNLVSKGLPLPFGCIKDNKRSLVSVDNLVDLIVTCIDHPKAVNQVFLVSDDNDVSTHEMVQQMAKALGKSQWQLPVPKVCYRFAGKIMSKEDVINRLLGSLQVDITHTKETLEWMPPQTIEDGFKQTADAFLQGKLKV